MGIVDTMVRLAMGRGFAPVPKVRERRKFKHFISRSYTKAGPGRVHRQGKTKAPVRAVGPGSMSQEDKLTALYLGAAHYRGTIGADARGFVTLDGVRV